MDKTVELLRLKEKINNKYAGNPDEFLIRAHHILCSAYGWISIEEFENMPYFAMIHLLKEIKKDSEKVRNNGKR